MPKVGNVETVTATVSATDGDGPAASQFAAMQNQEDAPPCTTCGSIMVRSGVLLQVQQLRHDERLRVAVEDAARLGAAGRHDRHDR